MTILMDDPSTYLQRDNDRLCMVLSPSLSLAQDMCRHYGVSIQAQLVGDGLAQTGVRVVTSYAAAVIAAASYPADTLWCAWLASGQQLDHQAFKALANKFGLPKTVAVALGVSTDGVAWRPEKTQLI